MDFKSIFESKKFKTAICIIAALIVFLLIFQAGIIVGFKKASFSYQWGENYYRNFAGPRKGLAGDFRGKEMMAPHGVFGIILKKENFSLVVKDIDNTEKLILINEDTIINRFRDNISQDDLKVNDKITVIGSPDNSGQIEARLIRVMPPEFSATATPNFFPPHK